MSSPHRARFVFQGLGTRGDIAPLASVGAELVRRGHECHLLANEAFGGEVATSGLRFACITRQAEIFWGAERGNPENFYFTCLPPVADYFRRHVLPARAASGRCTIVVNADRNLASNLLCELHELPVVRLYLTPYKVRSLAAPPWPMGRPCAGRLGRTFRKYALPKLFEAADKDYRRLSIINRRRASVGLPAVEACSYVERYVRRHIALFPNWFGLAAEDWPHGLECLGFPFAPSREPAPPVLDEFVERFGRPVVFTPGTHAPRAAPDFARMAEDCCAELGMPGVFLSPYTAALPPPRTERMLRLPYVDLGVLLERAALLVHHGGIGTTGQAIRAGIPQIVVPRWFDQPDNGRRVEKLGIGTAVASELASGRALAAAARTLLEAVSDGREGETKAKLAALKEDIERTDAITRCADILEGVAEHTQRRAPSIQVVRQRRTILFVVWPEAGHIAAPVAVARALQERGDRVVFASSEALATRIRMLGFEHVDLAGASDWGQRWSIFSTLPDRAALGEAIDRLSHTFQVAVERFRPSLVLFDSLYSAFSILAQAAAIPWAIYETDLPRELDPHVPPPQVMAVPDGSPSATDAIRTAWLNQLGLTFWFRENARREPHRPLDWTRRYFTSELIAELEARFGKCVAFDRFVVPIPVARGPRMVFCPRELDFERSRSARQVTWVGPCLDERRVEPDFPWNILPPELPIAYCAFGTQSLREAQAPVYLQTIADAFASREDYFLVIACPAQHRPATRRGARVLVVENAPQLALLRRAKVAITHAGFNSIKECARYAVPMVAMPLSHDQPRNAALIELRRLGVAFAPDVELTASMVSDAVAQATESAAIREGCARMRRVFERWPDCSAAVAFIDDRIASARPAPAPLARHRRAARPRHDRSVEGPTLGVMAGEE
jgi:rhamnosyltransferase subunit B